MDIAVRYPSGVTYTLNGKPTFKSNKGRHSAYVTVDANKDDPIYGDDNLFHATISSTNPTELRQLANHLTMVAEELEFNAPRGK